jgi:hypothetical protein
VIVHPDIDVANRCLDELHETMSRLHDDARTQTDLDQVVITRYWGQVSAWTDKYMRAFANLRDSKSNSEWRDRVSAIHGLYDEGLEIREDFRVWLVASLETLLAGWEKDLAEQQAEHPISYWILDTFVGPVFDGIDWLLVKTTKRGLYDRVTANQKTSRTKKI